MNVITLHPIQTAGLLNQLPSTWVGAVHNKAKLLGVGDQGEKIFGLHSFDGVTLICANVRDAINGGRSKTLLEAILHDLMHGVWTTLAVPANLVKRDIPVAADAESSFLGAVPEKP